ncbi:hypothetical protein [Natronorubrum texcoconense]|uniref:Uncharacterized protein n=1 Tax=Natronorubrum texcoconense TaxID=1095776 RepID=A0A1G9EZV8_9EURY|nr:hypothetical protein [Natronorubrum texcoconense]SDK81664.1 hypothetical protein SAMN04515672_4041 [Natronorubrum texcoconense]
MIGSSGAFDTQVADRGVGIETADDANAFLGLEYSNEARTLELASDDSDGGGFCFLACGPYEYTERELVEVKDNIPSGELVVEEISFEDDGDDIIDDLEYTDGNFVRGDFSCPASGSLFGYGDQEDWSATITIGIEASGGAVTIDLDRTVDIECVGD